MQNRDSESIQVDDFRNDRGLVRELFSQKAFRSKIPTLFLASMTVNVLSLALPLVLMQVYDRIIPTRAMSTLLWLAIGFGAALIVETILRLCRSTVTNWMASRFDHFVSTSCVDKWVRSKLEDYERDGVGTHLDRLSAVTSLRGFFSGQAFQMLMDMPFVLLYLGAIYYLGGQWVAVYAASVMVIYLFISLILKGRYGARREVQKTLNDRRYNFLVESLGGVHTVKSLTAEEQMLRRHERLQADMGGNNFYVAFFGTMPQNLGSLFSQITLFGILLVGGLQVIGGTMTLGALAACSILGGRVLQPIQSLASFLVRLSDIRIARDRISDAARLSVDILPDSPSLPPEIDGRLTFEDVSFRYDDGADLIFDTLSLDIRPGEMVCIAGAEGAGTSTLLSLAMGLTAPVKGRVLVDGEYDLAIYGRHDLRGRMEFLAQNGTLFNGTIFDNITFFNPHLEERAQDAASLLGLDQVISELPKGFETVVGNRLFEFLPSGIIQRICVARALTVRPRILIVDKSTESMDSESEQIFLWLLGKLKGHCTILAATSSEDMIRLSDRFYRVRDGKLTLVTKEMRRDRQEARQ